MHDLATLGLQIAGFAGLATVLGFLWSLIKAAAQTQEVVKRLPGQVEGVDNRVGQVDKRVAAVEGKVDQLARDHDQTRKGLADVQAHQQKVEEKVNEVKGDVRVMRELDQFQTQERIRRRMDPNDRER